MSKSDGKFIDPRSVYIHVPFCRHRCGYCNFTLIANRDDLIDDYLKAIQVELDLVKQQHAERSPVDTIYLGGGTPGRLPSDKLQQLLDMLNETFEFQEDGEFTIEMNPDNLTDAKIAGTIEQSAINRISMGVQSFNVQKLRSLDRDHDRQQIEDALQTAREIVSRFSIDLIFAAPFDSLEIWPDDLDAAIESSAQHISTYELTYEKGTRFWNQLNKGQLQQKEQDNCVEFYQRAIEKLTDGGYEHYEISSFGKPGFRSQHNQVYWTGKPWWALGPGASGLIDGRRFTNHRSVTRYLKSVLSGETAVEESQPVSMKEIAIDRVVFGLRMIEGIDLGLLKCEFGFELSDLVPESTLQLLIDNELIYHSAERLALTAKGLLLGDYVCSTLLQDATTSN